MKEFHDIYLLGHRKRMPEILGTKTDEPWIYFLYSMRVISSGFPLFPLGENQIILLRKKTWTVQNFFNIFSAVCLLFYVSQTDINQTWMHNALLQGLRFFFFNHWSGLSPAIHHWLKWVQSICQIPWTTLKILGIIIDQTFSSASDLGQTCWKRRADCENWKLNHSSSFFICKVVTKGKF